MATATIAGNRVEINEEGFLVDPDKWNEQMAPQLAAQVGIEKLTEAHWKVIQFMRKDFKETGKVPSIRRIKANVGVPIQDIYRLFPEGPAKKAAYVSGLGKPEGCV